MTTAALTPSKTRAYSRRYDKLRRSGYYQTVDGTITRRKLAALQAIGYSLTDLAARIGRSQQSLSESFLHTEAPIHRTTAKAVDALYEQLQGKPCSGPYAKRTRIRARRLGYPSPVAWDDINDIHDEPRGVRK